jgi:2,4-dienoyl-CoA reductase-like NADH-dependent reductase (Old Yellow Enzyme family)
MEVVEAVSEIWGPDRVGVRLSPLGNFNDMSDAEPECGVALLRQYVPAPQAEALKVITQQIVRAFVTSPIHFRRGCADQCTVQIEGPQQTGLVKSHIGLNSLECLFAHKK